MLGDTGNKRAVRILLECILVTYATSHFTNNSKMLVACLNIPLNTYKWFVYGYPITNIVLLNKLKSYNN